LDINQLNFLSSTALISSTPTNFKIACIINISANIVRASNSYNESDNKTEINKPFFSRVSTTAE